MPHESHLSSPHFPIPCNPTSEKEDLFSSSFLPRKHVKKNHPKVVTATTTLRRRCLTNKKCPLWDNTHLGMTKGPTSRRVNNGKQAAHLAHARLEGHLLSTRLTWDTWVPDTIPKREKRTMTATLKMYCRTKEILTSLYCQQNLKKTPMALPTGESMRIGPPQTQSYTDQWGNEMFLNRTARVGKSNLLPPHHLPLISKLFLSECLQIYMVQDS